MGNIKTACRKEKTAIWKMKTEMDKITDIQNVNKKVPILTSMLLDGRKKKVLSLKNGMKLSTLRRKTCFIGREQGGH